MLSLRWEAMISSIFKPAVTRAITPAAKGALKLGLTPNTVTFFGATAVVLTASYFYPRSEFFLGTVLICFFSLSDLFDGTMARISQKGASPWGGFLDSTIDRIADASIFIGVIIALNRSADPLVPVVVIALATGSLIPYIRAKAESMDIQCTGGIAERTERLMIALLGIGLEGLGVNFALAICMWVLLILGVITVLQRIFIVKRAL